jgi:type I restriction enzyme S subunit
MTGRHDARYYLPRFTRLEDRVAARATGKLRDYSRQSAGGATPKAEEKEKYYSDDPETGIPFIRVQNLSVSGALSLDDVKLINRETHNGMLARSHVGPDDLLTKITGVGRMAVSSVPPPGFEGNINQHLVRIKTKDRHTSEVLAAYLNTDIAEQLATRRATGGTRPALDYPALRSIPIIFDERILPIASAARDRRKQRLEEASALLASIDDYLLSELGIVLPPETENTLANRTFRVSAHELGGWRFDPLFHAFKMWHAIENSGIPSARLGTICASVKTGFAAGGNDQADGNDGIIQIRPTNIDSDRRLKFDRNIYIAADLATRRPREILKPGEVLFNNTNSQALVGKTTFFDLTDQLYACSNHITRLTLNRDKALPEYLTAILNLYQRRKAFFSICTNWNNQSGVGADLLRKIVVPVPDMDVQQAIVEEVRAIFGKAENLRATATAELETAKREIEAILLDSP